jgi:succinate dehydrogenase/fumarate reductase flavoprotein subunit
MGMTTDFLVLGSGIAGLSLTIKAADFGMEFMQLHPTCLYHQDAKSFLIKKAVKRQVHCAFSSWGVKSDCARQMMRVWSDPTSGWTVREDTL